MGPESNFVGLLPSRGRHLQLQPAAECLGVRPLVQHAQPGSQGESSPSLTQTAKHLKVEPSERDFVLLCQCLLPGCRVLRQHSCSPLAAVWRDAELAVSLRH